MVEKNTFLQNMPFYFWGDPVGRKWRTGLNKAWGGGLFTTNSPKTAATKRTLFW